MVSGIRSRVSRLGGMIALSLLAVSPAQAQFGRWFPLGPDGGSGGPLGVSLTEPGTLFSIAGLDVFRSINGGKTWLRRGAVPPDRFLDRIDSMAVGRDQTLFVGTFARLAISRDGGLSWTTTQGFGSEITNLVVSPSDPRAVYLFAFVGGLWRSEDEGATWTLVATPPSDFPDPVLDDLEIHPRQPRTLFATTDLGFFRSTDGGASWSPPATPVEGLARAQLAIDPDNPLRLRATSNDSLFGSEDGGVTWTEIAPLPSANIHHLLFDRRVPGRLWRTASLSRQSPIQQSVSYSDDGGVSWRLPRSPDGRLQLLGNAGQMLQLDLPGRPIVIATLGGPGILRDDPSDLDRPAVLASNEGLERTNVLALSAALGPRLIAGTSGGLRLSKDRGHSWTTPTRDGGFPMDERAYLDIEFPATYGDHGFAISADRLLETNDAGERWSTLLVAGDATLRHLAVELSGVAYVSMESGFSNAVVEIYRSDDTSDPIGTPLSSISAMKVDPFTDGTLYIAGRTGGDADDALFQSLDGGQTWALLRRFDAVQDIAVSSFFSDRLFVITRDELLVSNDAGATWQVLSDNLPDRTTDRLIADPNDGNAVYAATPNGPFRFNPTARFWFELGRGLRDRGVRDLAFSPTGDGRIYAASSDFFGGAQGVYVNTQMCDASDSALCLDDNPFDRRFEIRLEFETAAADGRGGEGRVLPLAPLGVSRGGLIHFGNPANPEFLVKILDGCDVNGHFWVFSAGATNLGYRLSVRDMVRGVEKIYRNEDGTNAPTVNDTRAFETCPASRSARGSTPPEASSARGPTIATRHEPRLAGVGCVPDDTTLCLDDRPGDRRFAITMRFESAAGGGVMGDARGQTLGELGVARGGLLSFRNLANPEVLIKVLNACSINDRYWVFFGAATDLGYTIEVTDTRTGSVRSYENPDGRAAISEADTQAFATCDA